MTNDSAYANIPDYSLIEIHDLPSELDEDAWLDDVAARVRSNLSQAVVNLVRTGQYLQLVRETMPGRFTRWIDEQFPFSITQAYIYIRSAKIVMTHVPQGKLNKLIASPSALKKLAMGDVPEEVRRDVLQQALDGQAITLDMVNRAAKAAIERKLFIDLVDEVKYEEVRDLAYEHDLHPAVIPLLDELKEARPDTFDEISASGAVYDFRGEAIPLHEATERDVRAYIDHDRFEYRLAQRAQDEYVVKFILDDVVPPSMTDIASEDLQELNFEPVTVAISQAIEEAFRSKIDETVRYKSPKPIEHCKVTVIGYYLADQYITPDMMAVSPIINGLLNHKPPILAHKSMVHSVTCITRRLTGFSIFPKTEVIIETFQPIS